MIHHIKLSEFYAEAVLSGEKCFEIRYNDRGYQKGDRVVFQTVDEDGTPTIHQVSREIFVITYVVHGYGLKDGWCVFGIKRKE